MMAVVILISKNREREKMENGNAINYDQWRQDVSTYHDQKKNF